MIRFELSKQLPFFIQRFNYFFPATVLSNLARKTGYLRRKPRKITASRFLLGWLMVAFQDSPSLSKIAATIALSKAGSLLSKQALSSRITPRAIALVSILIQRFIKTQITRSNLILPEQLKAFERVIIQDSTTISLSRNLHPHFPATKHDSSPAAALKIQTFYNYLNASFLHFSISPFTHNDQAAALEILPHIKPKDLVIRDMGYFTFSSLRAIEKGGATFLSRLKYGVSLFSLKGNELVPFILAKKLKKHKFLDKTVYMGADHQPVRLVAIAAPDEVANQRRRTEKQRYHRDKNHSDQYYFLLGWNIFITNATEEQLSHLCIIKTYGIRWSIETIFKCWKSNLHITAAPKASRDYIELLIAIHLLAILLVFSAFYRLQNELMKTQKQPLSILRFTSFIANHLVDPLQIVLPLNDDRTIKAISYYCSYDKRKRLNSWQKIQSLT